MAPLRCAPTADSAPWQRPRLKAYLFLLAKALDDATAKSLSFTILRQAYEIAQIGGGIRGLGEPISRAELDMPEDRETTFS